MFKFGKKVNYRPILVSLAFALIPIIGIGHFYPLRGILAGLLVFLLVVLIYYLPNLSILFSYWQADNNEIKFNDMSNLSHRLTMILLPFKNQLSTIKEKDIHSITVLGKLEDPKEMTYAMQVGAYYAILTPIISMIKNPVSLELTMNNGQKVQLSISRDYAYDHKKTIAKLDQFFGSLDNTQIKVNNYHKISFS
ncbi:hypothetical protein [Companilactobacillus nuruki]|uniref:Uncharacterized protein n=1 Tax=Companilactobacillus nuruki TaxID=1993540 RepID=A0A2N7AWL0_9LACO|nr:hypothetical protein [Companilactobacillus nuruki]PMD73138.1 hypothetical protein CBP76_03110 [Companilactobacillus nuruki]